jgi:hypothetical protein
MSQSSATPLNARKRTATINIDKAVQEFIEKHPRATIREAAAHAKTEFHEEKQAAEFIRVWLKRVSAPSEYAGEVERRWRKEKYD